MSGGMWGIRMAVVLLSVGQTPICTFQGQNNITLMPDFNIFQAKGAWNFNSVATNGKLSDEDREDIKMLLTVVSPFTNGSVNLQTTITSSEGTCKEVNAIYTKENNSEQYKNSDGNSCYFQVIDTDYENYGIIYLGNSEKQDYFQVQLYGRTKEVTEKALKKFQEVTKSLGVPEENVIKPSKSACS